MSRTRIRTLGIPAMGTYKSIGQFGTPGATDSQVGQTNLIARSTIVDEFRLKDAAFTVEHRTVEGNVFSSVVRGPGQTLRQVNNWSFDMGMPGYSHVTDPNEPSLPALAVSCLQRTNPSKSHVDLPVAIAELRELPDLVKRGGESIAEKFAHGTLQREFGFTPFYNDLRKLVDFKDKVQKRVELLSKFKDGPLLRKTKLYDSTVSGVIPADRVVLTEAFGTMSVHVDSITTTRRYYGYVTYTPTADMSKLLSDPEALRARAWKIIGGMTIDASNLWQAMPWSWLADWFGNLGDYLDAHRNLLPLQAGTPRICRPTETVITLTLPGNTSTGPVNKKYSHKITSKSRTPASAAFPSASLPLLTGRQVNILASLYVTRGRGGSHG